MGVSLRLPGGAKKCTHRAPAFLWLCATYDGMYRAMIFMQSEDLAYFAMRPGSLVSQGVSPFGCDGTAGFWNFAVAGICRNIPE
jgi:hypothetical protein